MHTLSSSIAIPLVVGVFALFALGGCGEHDHDHADGAAAAPATAGPAWLLRELPADPQRIITIKASEHAVGENVTVLGRIGGRTNPFVAGRGMMLIADDVHATPCDAMADDHCAIPWDFCCENPSVVKEALALVQLVDADGNALATDIEGIGGLQGGAHVVIQGSVQESEDPSMLTIAATGIYLAQAGGPTNRPGNAPASGEHHDHDQ